MKAKEIRDLTDEELGRKISDLKAELFNLRFGIVTGQVSNPMLIKVLKKDMARVQTIIRERELQKKKA